MNPEIALTVGRVERSRADLDRRARGRLPSRPTVLFPETGALEVGARVFDLVTGQEGEIVGGTRQDLLIPAPDKRDG